MAKLIIVGGSPATGKTTVAKQLQAKTGYVRVSMDEIKETLFDVVGFRDREWSKQIGKAAWPVFQKFVHLHLDRGDSVIAEATFLWPSDADWLHELAEAHGVDLIQVWMTADPSVARDRFMNRAKSERHPGHNDAHEAVVEEFENRFFNKTFIPLPLNGRTIVIDTTDDDADLTSIIEVIEE